MDVTARHDMSPNDGTEKKSDLIARGNRLQPAVMVGKDGLSPGVIQDAGAQLRAKKLIKVKIQTRMDREDVRAIAEKMAEETGSRLLQVKGRTFLLHRETKG
jgi:RNA-binding protein